MLSGERWKVAGCQAVALVVVAVVLPAVAVASHGGVAHSPGNLERGFELVSPPYKESGNGVGDPSSSSGALGGSGAYVGDRFAVYGHLGAIMLDSPFATASDYALAERVSDLVGWRSHSANTRAFQCNQNYRMQQMAAAAPDFSTLLWGTNAGSLPFFEEICAMGANRRGQLVSDWGSPPGEPTRWEPIGPLDVAQDFRSNPDVETPFGTSPAISGDGSHLALSGAVRGLAGSGDPTWDTVGPDPWSAYLDDISAGLSDSWPGAGVRIPAALCTGSDDEPEDGAGPVQGRTAIPARGEDGELGEVACDGPADGRDGRLVSDYGSVTSWGQPGTTPVIGVSNVNVVSTDGSRAFFMAPDPRLDSAENPGAVSCSADVGPGTRCPAQLYVRQRNADGEVVTRWVSRPDDELVEAGFSASLLGPAHFEGASADGSRVFFRTNSPLTVDDPNGEHQDPDNPAFETVKANRSWDLYMFELASGPDPTGPGSALTRITAGPDGTSDCGTRPSASATAAGIDTAALRFASEDGRRVYFACAAPLVGVGGRDTGTAAGDPGGAPTTTDLTNVYLWDANVADPADRYTFVARIPRATGTSASDRPTRCASTAAQVGLSAIGVPVPFPAFLSRPTNCWRGTADGSFASFWTFGRLTGDDPHELGVGASGDIYAFDVAADELVRVTAPQGGDDSAYPCGSPSAGLVCYGDQGFSASAAGVISAPNPFLSVVTDPEEPGERVVYFESRSRLVDGDGNDAYDVYEWRDGVLSLVSLGDEGAGDSFYMGNSADGRNVYLATEQALSWQDVDAVNDIYVARLGGGIVEPEPSVVCALLAGGCHGPGAAAVGGPVPATSSPAPGGDAVVGPRRALAVAGLSAVQRRRAARSGRLVLSVRLSGPGRVRALARTRIGGRARRVARGSVRVGAAGRARLGLRLGGVVRRRLARGVGVRLVVRVGSPGALRRSMIVRLPGARS